MAIDASIISRGVQPVQMPDPMNRLAQVMQIQSAQNQNSLAQYGLAKAQRQDQESTALADLIRGGVDINTPEGQAKAYGVAPFSAPGLIKQQLENRNITSQIGEREATAKSKEYERATKGYDLFQQVVGAHINNPNATPGGVVQSVQGLVDAGVIDPKVAGNLVQKIPQDPSQLHNYLSQVVSAQMKPHELMTIFAPKAEKVDTGGSVQMVDTNPNSPTFGKPVMASMPKTATPDAVLSARTSTDNNNRTIAKDYAINGLNPDGTPKTMPLAVDGSLDLSKVAPEDLAAAHRYRADGTLPPNMGRGAQGAAESKRIRAIATALDAQAGESPEDARIRQLALKGDVGAIAAMRKREVAVGANVKNFDFNADQVLQLSNKVDRTGVPIINAWLNAGRRSVAGNPDLAAFDVAVKTTVNEFAQIVSGTTSGGSTEGEKKKAEALLNAQQTPEQVLSVINQMRIESKNRMQSFANQRREAMPTNRGAPAAAAAPTVAAGLPDTSAIDAELRRRAGGN